MDLSRDKRGCYHAGYQGDRSANMRALIRTVAMLSAVAISAAGLAQGVEPFDGKWTTIVSCPQAEGAGSFTLLVDADVRGGVFSGEKGTKGKPGVVFADWEGPARRQH